MPKIITFIGFIDTQLIDPANIAFDNMILPMAIPANKTCSFESVAIPFLLVPRLLLVGFGVQ